MIAFPGKSVACGLLAALLVWPSTRESEAHPHVWIDATVSPRFEDGAVVALDIDWRFDDFYSSVVAQDFDTNSNGTLDQDELQALAQVSMTSLADFGYFTHIYLDAGDAIGTEVTELTVRLAESGAIHYVYSVALPEPINPAERSLSFSLYDASYYVDVALDRVDPVRLQGAGAESCHFALVEDRDRPFYFGMVVPIRVDILCGVS